jgi:phage baseplate assembly protein W
MLISTRTAPFLGKGIAWPLRINPATGGFQMCEANFNTISLAMGFTPDPTSIREDVDGGTNKLREAMAHILTTIVGEYDFLPKFGSRTSALINDPNNEYSRMEYETWAELAIARWEKRVIMQAPQNFEWRDNNDDIDKGIVACKISPEIISTQTSGNLVTPFVTARDCRAQEFPLGDVDSEGHDWASRYHGQTVYSVGSERFLRPRKVLPISYQSDDGFYTVKRGDTWFSISSKIYDGEVRFGWALQDFYTNDVLEAGGSRSCLKVTQELEPGTLLRYPSKTRILTQMAA